MRDAVPWKKVILFHVGLGAFWICCNEFGLGGGVLCAIAWLILADLRGRSTSPLP